MAHFSLYGSQLKPVRQITDYRRITPFDRDVRGRLRQGPIQPGGYLVPGSCEDSILGDQGYPEQAERDADSFDGFEKLQICVAVLHGPSKNHVGVRSLSFPTWVRFSAWCRR